MPHSIYLYPMVETDADPSTKKYTKQSKVDSQPTRLTSSVSLSAISRTV